VVLVEACSLLVLLCACARGDHAVSDSSTTLIMHLKTVHASVKDTQLHGTEWAVSFVLDSMAHAWSTYSYSYSFYASRNILLVHKLKERKNRP
jgi:alpha-D-ribose 1-methylphosphonate 5-triphosphate synthase subunit PhnH